ncbi:Polysaccharide biosynthesis protein [Methanosarcina sp. MTP4]|uniref:flippase n=1 Tax=Methanosarcina sp. MTP4 TaxID=1434100 RepID=UPI0006154B37|nr:flippase [Methanosarcina sp. MTP4]AKB23625.1 Polysaccharide biosynthesis protein [Methanosarcina sp. MTP4]
MPYRKFIKDVGLIGITQALIGLGGFFLLPVITKTLGSYDYGIWAQINITVSLLSPLALMGLSMGVVRFLSSEKDIEKIREGFFSVIFFVAFTGLLISIVVFLLSDFLAASIFKDISTSGFIKVGAFLILLSAIDQISIFYFRVSRQTETFAFLTLFQTLGQLILILSFLLMGFGLFGVISAVLIVQGLLFIISTYKIVSQIGFGIPKFNQIGEYLKYSAPLTPNSLIRWITDSSDRYMVSYFLGLSQVGIYSASYAIGSLIQLFITPIQFILFPELSRLFDEGKSDEVKVYLGNSMKYFLLIAIPAVFGLSALAKPMLEILTTQEFISGSIVIPFIALSGLLSGIFQIVINITHLVKKTKFNLYIHIFAALLNIVFNFLLIPSIGIVGAAIATLISYTLMVIVCILVSFKHIEFNLNFGFILKSIMASSIMFGVIFCLNPSNIMGLFGSVLLGAFVYLAIMILIKGISRNELNLIKNFSINIRNMISNKIIKGDLR